MYILQHTPIGWNLIIEPPASRLLLPGPGAAANSEEVGKSVDDDDDDYDSLIVMVCKLMKILLQSSNYD